MDKKLINGLVIDRAVVSIKEILFQCYNNDNKSLEIISLEINSFVESLKSENNG